MRLLLARKSTTGGPSRATKSTPIETSLAAAESRRTAATTRTRLVQYESHNLQTGERQQHAYTHVSEEDDDDDDVESVCQSNESGSDSSLFHDAEEGEPLFTNASSTLASPVPVSADVTCAQEVAQFET